jgi:hypothetical protein
MKLICSKSDGTLLGRVADNQLRFAVPPDACIVGSPEDLSEEDLPNGSSLAQIISAKNNAFQASHPNFANSLQFNLEFVSPSCDVANSSRVTIGPGKGTCMAAGLGSVWTSDTILCGPVNAYLCPRISFFLLGSQQAGSNLRYYNYDEVSGGFIDPSSVVELSLALVNAANPGVVLTSFASDQELETPVLMGDFKVQVTALALDPLAYRNMRLFISDFSLLVKQVPLPPH